MEAFVSGVMGQDPQFHLGIVRRDEDMQPSAGTKGLANPNALLGPDGNVLHVRVRGGQPPRGGASLMKGWMNPAASFRSPMTGKSIDVGALQLRQPAPSLRMNRAGKFVVGHQLLRGRSSAVE